MALAPSLERIDHGTQALASLRQSVFNPRRYFGIDLADDQPVILKRTELFGQHTLGDSGHPSPQLAKALGAVLQVEQDDAFPLAVDQIERRLDRAAGPMREISPFHADFLDFFWSFSNGIQTGIISPNLQYLPRSGQRENENNGDCAITLETTGMKAVGYK